MKKTFLAACASLALGSMAAPAVAQDGYDEADFAALTTGVAEELGVEPLTPEQKARLPQARLLMAQVVPDGVMGEVMDGLLGGFLGEIALESGIDPNAALNDALGYYFALDLEPQAAEDALAIIDPAWRERAEAEQAIGIEFAATLMEAMEPALRDAMAELYAVYFTEDELNDIAAFYATPTGQVFARRSITMSSDPRLLASLMGSENFWETFSSLDAVAEDDWPSSDVRSFADLSPEEQRRLAILTGQRIEDLENALSWEKADAAASDADVDAVAAEAGAKIRTERPFKRLR